MIEIPPALWAALAGFGGTLLGWRTTQWNNKLTAAKVDETDQSALHGALANMQQLLEWQTEAQGHIETCLRDKHVLLTELDNLREDMRSKQRDVVNLQSEVDSLQSDRVKSVEEWTKRARIYEQNALFLSNRVADYSDSMERISRELMAEKEWRLNHCRQEHAKEAVND